MYEKENPEEIRAIDGSILLVPACSYHNTSQQPDRERAILDRINEIN